MRLRSPIRLAGAVLAGALVLAACGGSGTDDEAASEATEAAAAPADEETEEDAGEADGDAAEAAEGETFEFEHFAGTTEVPTDPQRIVVLQDQNALLPLLELGVRPIASAALVEEDGSCFFRRVENYDVEDIECVGAYGEPDLEQVASQQPDLIIGGEFDEGIYDQLSQIAPTVLIQIFDRPFVEALEDFAVVVGEEEKHDELLAEYEQNVADLVADLPRPPEEIVLTQVQFSTDGQFWSPSGQAVGTVLDDVGFARPEAELEAINDDEYGFDESLETLSTRGEADVMITADFSADGDNEAEEIAQIREEPVFQELDVVQRDEFHVFDGGDTVGSAFEKMNNFLDFLRSILVERDPNLTPAE